MTFGAACCVPPTLAGIELYGWACGLTGVRPKEFNSKSELTALVVDVPRPKVMLPNLLKPGEGESDESKLQ